MFLSNQLHMVGREINIYHRTNQKQRRVIQVAEDIRYLHDIIDKLSIIRRLWISIAGCNALAICNVKTQTLLPFTLGSSLIVIYLVCYILNHEGETKCFPILLSSDLSPICYAATNTDRALGNNIIIRSPIPHSTLFHLKYSLTSVCSSFEHPSL